MFVEVAYVEEVCSSEVGMLGKVVLVLLAVEAGAIEEGSGFLPSRQVLDCAITTYAITACDIKTCIAEVDSEPRCQSRCRFLKQVKGASISLWLQILYMVVEAARAANGSS